MKDTEGRAFRNGRFGPLTFLSAGLTLLLSVEVAWGFQQNADVLPLASQRISFWMGPDGQPLPYQTNRQIEAFLLKAKVKSSDDVSTGINRVKKLLLELDGIEANAVFRDVSVRQQKVKTPTGWRLDFRDDCRYECAAYRLSEMLGLECVPPAVQRSIQGKKGTVQIWIERAKMESERQKEELEPPDQRLWNAQIQTMRLFDNLIYNDDRNQGNLLIDQNWKIWLIDHTRAFRTLKDPPNPQLIWICDETIYENLKQLTLDDLKKEVGDYLRDVEIKSLLARRDKLVEKIQADIDQRGKGQVLFNLQ